MWAPLQPANVKVKGDRTVKVLDFGLVAARFVGAWELVVSEAR